ncbi:hypothetical protein K440DRAFT_627382 [Wilcoxina mikolae CBS 423.85]|nr:hypothetical protein K440DRAFT_627382 [Wilcoxina mikolae CBS 423.85]
MPRVLGRECKRDREAVQVEVWRVVVTNLKGRGRLKVVESAGIGEDGEGMLEDWEVELLMVEDSDLENMLEDSEDDDLLVEESEEEFECDWELDVDG